MSELSSNVAQPIFNAMKLLLLICLSSLSHRFFDSKAYAQKYLNGKYCEGYKDHKFSHRAERRLVAYHHQCTEKDRETAKGKYCRENGFELFFRLWRGRSVGEECKRDLCVNIDRKLNRTLEDYLEKYFKQEFSHASLLSLLCVSLCCQAASSSRRSTRCRTLQDCSSCPQVL